MTLISKCTESVLRDAATSLKAGNLVAFPTETVYGLGADATNEKAVARIYEVKGRPTDHPLIVHISSIARLEMWAKNIPDYALKLAHNFWPGPMTLILPRTNLAKNFITGSQNSVGIRIPAHTVALSLIEEFEAQGGNGLAAPSANRFGAVSPTTASAVEIELDKYLSPCDRILDGGCCEVGIESTIIDCTKKLPVVVRPGYITFEMLEDFLPIKINIADNLFKGLKAPGLLDSHYSPKAKVVINGDPKPGDGFIALAKIPTPIGVTRLANPVNENEYAKLLYEALRSADKRGIDVVHVIPPTDIGIGLAINNRLKKAAARTLKEKTSRNKL
jgi:L-threonylcarbamoyladenylate synthase